MIKRIQTIIVSALLVFVFLAVTASGVIAAPPRDIHIEVDEILGTNGEAFVANGSAVVDGTLCASGTVDDVSIVSSGPQNGTFVILHVLKRFICDDLSGTFDVRLVVKLNLTTRYTTARWNVVSGTGNYTHLHGNGSLEGTPIVPGVSIHDVYDGNMH